LLFGYQLQFKGLDLGAVGPDPRGVGGDIDDRLLMVLESLGGFTS